jgi:hypothetical protein
MLRSWFDNGESELYACGMRKKMGLDFFEK